MSIRVAWGGVQESTGVSMAGFFEDFGGGTGLDKDTVWDPGVSMGIELNPKKPL